MKIKICGNTSIQNVSEMEELCPDYLGYIFYPNSSRYLDPDKAVEIIPNYPMKNSVGVFVNESCENILKISTLLNLHAVQLHGNETPEFCNLIRKHVLVIKALDGNDLQLQEKVNAYENTVDFYLIDNMDKNYGGSGNKFDLSILFNVQFKKPFFIAGGIGPEDAELVKSFLNIQNFYGLDLNSKFELSPGVKDKLLLNEFINAIV